MINFVLAKFCKYLAELSKKRDRSQSIIMYGIHTLNANCVPNIMILAQVAIQMFCSQCPFSDLGILTIRDIVNKISRSPLELGS